MLDETSNKQQLLDAKVVLVTEFTNLRISTMASRLAEDLIRAKNSVVDELVEKLREVRGG